MSNLRARYKIYPQRLVSVTTTTILINTFIFSFAFQAILTPVDAQCDSVEYPVSTR